MPVGVVGCDAHPDPQADGARGDDWYDCVVAPPIAAQSDASGLPPDWGQRVH